MPQDSPPAASRLSRRGLAIAGIVVVAGLGFVVTSGIASRGATDVRLREWTEAQAVPTVSVVAPVVGGNKSTLDLPGRLEAYARAPIYARVSGFLKTFKVDIGAPVKAGELLAEIEAPDLDQQLLQARATLASAQASEQLAKVTAQRWQSLVGTNAVSRQAADEKAGDLSLKAALAKAAQANVDRLGVLADFKRVVAPFDGIITTRNTDLGALINADSSSGLALFVVSDVKKLRLNINVPQNYVPAIKLDTKVQIAVPEYPGRTYEGVVEASARAVDAASGTTRMQVVVDNAGGELMPGAFANVRIDLLEDMKALSIPSSALIFDQAGLHVATVDAGGKVLAKKVTIARDLGQIVEIGAGLAATDRVIDSPPDGLADGDAVQVVANTAASAKKK